MKSGKRGKFGKQKEKALLFAVLLTTLAFVSVTAGCASGATAPEEAWNQTFGGTGYDGAHSVQQTSDGGYILAGWTRSYGAGYDDFWLVKTDANGNEHWNKTFGGSNYEDAGSVQQTADGGYILAGMTKSYGDGIGDFWLVKTDSDGNKQWDKTFGITGRYDRAYSAQQTADGGYIGGGYTSSYGAGDYDFWLVKTDANGNKQWNETFGGTDGDWAYSVQQTSDGGYILAGCTCSYGAGGEDVWLVKTDANGNKQWDKTFGGTGYERAWSVQQTADDGYILAGWTRSYGAGGEDGWLVKTDSNGNKQWDKTFGGTGSDKAYSVQQTADGGYVLAGYTESYGAGGEDVWLVKTDSSGNKQWDKTFGGTGSERAGSVQQTADGGYILAGWTESYGAGDYDLWLIKVKGEEPTEPSISIYTDKYEYSPGDTMTVTLGFKNPTTSSVDTYLIWYFGLPDYGYWKQIFATPFTLPPNFDQSYDISIPVGAWAPVGFDAAWYVALLETSAPYETISEDTADWRYVSAVRTQGEIMPEEIAKEIMKKVEEVKILS